MVYKLAYTTERILDTLSLNRHYSYRNILGVIFNIGSEVEAQIQEEQKCIKMFFNVSQDRLLPNCFCLVSLSNLETRLIIFSVRKNLSFIKLNHATWLLYTQLIA